MKFTKRNKNSTYGCIHPKASHSHLILIHSSILLRLANSRNEFRRCGAVYMLQKNLKIFF